MTGEDWRERAAREIYASLHHLMRVGGHEAQDAYERAAVAVAGVVLDELRDRGLLSNADGLEDQ